MAVTAINAKLAFMHIILAVAGLTFGRSLAIFCLWFVATLAFCGAMFIFKDKTRFVMLEERLVKYHNLRVSPLMIEPVSSCLKSVLLNTTIFAFRPL